ncbi:cupin domain-containing protein [Hydrogenophaga aquatica]
MKDLDTLYAAIDALSLEGGWHRKTPSLWPEPRKNFVPYIWRYAEVKPILEAAGYLVDHRMADRRNLTMTNPIEGNLYATARTMVAAYQSIKPGECADSHRHTPNALRIILEGRGSYTTVNGTRVEMRPGDVLLTPSMNWHAHESVGPDECFWVDVLDVPLVHLLEPMFFERHPDKLESEIQNVAECDLALRWEESLRRLAAAEPSQDGVTQRQVELGSPALKTMAVHVLRMSKGFASRQHRTTANAIYTVIEGQGVTDVDGTPLEWRRGDVFVVPAWRSHQHTVTADAHLVRVSDEPVMKAFGLLHKDKVDHA